jgi:hypothetical protein
MRDAQTAVEQAPEGTGKLSQQMTALFLFDRPRFYPLGDW